MMAFPMKGKMTFQNRWDVKATNLNSLDPSAKHLSSKVGHDLTTLIGERYEISLQRYNPIQRNYDTRDLQAQPCWPFFETEDAKDSLSLLRGEPINSSPPNLMPRQSRRISSHLYDLDDDFAKEICCEDGDNLGQPSGKYTRTPILHKSRATKQLSQKWLLEGGCNSVDIDLGFSSSHCTSQANLPSVGSWLWAEDPIGAFPVPELNLDVKSYFNTPKQSESIHCSPFSCFTSEKFAFCLSLNHTNCFDSPIFWINQACPISRFRKTRCSFGIERLDFLVYHQYKDELMETKIPTSQLRIEHIVMGGSNPNSKEDEFKEVKDGTLEKKGSLGVETSSSLKIHKKGESKGEEEKEKNGRSFKAVSSLQPSLIQVQVPLLSYSLLFSSMFQDTQRLTPNNSFFFSPPPLIILFLSLFLNLC
ncbi:hypothetical protein CXB51_001693 [Gossypium anomalum]|uniref:Uncharacterized protein n=1 Tax=Gossypium anomalum TaxID=47600 RepID=A0A8J6DF57_9ROSI|nr:hypothetical protein CXB51_001693 [Gossypium anomalum]